MLVADWLSVEFGPLVGSMGLAIKDVVSAFFMLSNGWLSVTRWSLFLS
jgi:hypothetical protein